MEAIKELRLFLLDMDGTIYLDDQLFDSVTESLVRMHQRRPPE